MSSSTHEIAGADLSESRGVALVFGASTENGQAAIEGLLDAGYFPVYGVTRDVTCVGAVEASNRGCILMEADLAKPESVAHALTETKAEFVFLVTTTDFPPNSETYAEAEEKEYLAIKSFFYTLVKVYREDQTCRHIIFSTLDNVKKINEELSYGHETQYINSLEDGSVCAHYTGKARGGEYAMKLLGKYPDLSITLLTLPFLHSNLMGFAIPLPNEAKTQWTIEAAFGEASIDMFSARDLTALVPSIFGDRELYDNYNVKVTAEEITLYEVATIFSDLYGKDVIYNPLTVNEMAELDHPGAPCFAQMCKFLSHPRSVHDIDVTEAIMYPRKPQLFKDWLLTHSDNKAFEEVGLTADESPIITVTVFGATGKQGTSVIRGLLADTRKEYIIRATSRDITQEKALAVKLLDSERVTLVQANFDDIDSCARAVDGADGVFLVTDFFEGAGMDPIVEEAHACNVIDACEAAHSVRHLVFSTLESIEDMNHHLDLGIPFIEDGKGRRSCFPQFDAKARAAAYARKKKLSCTFVLMPVYSERFFELLTPQLELDEETGKEKLVMHIPKGSPDDEELAVMCMSVEKLGPAVANIFDSYQVYAGHEIGLVTDFVTMSNVAEMIEDTFFEETHVDGTVTKRKVEKKDVTVDSWVEKRETVAKDMGQMFSFYSHTNAVQKRRSVAKTLELVPDAKPLKEWLQQNKDNVAFRQSLGLR
uniref:NmrA-like domain-containing protein n=1 Tax=Attheya septentrionalis TaxID=420275 RepID=A0A6T7GCQ3_9STRA|mmetsp:Transcript_17730/g.32053  ORF Transcript_17730/g.32053 Transcript_17730/m.32053 type:complete len:708 (+) Transcript_17730:183-2306(+)|eukprot:CAMPEP_0198285892 /NCGR_PEP_ID=MMETSP1449-20131203/5134_1 /TAXON_ID=420275 /ORGANISM="Attheya septentrionalis, Strain CCMP2084" /LENGTH=707 /DNA_ID=CAMNT_0043983505 /DNA_START=143 /DNA_END=2266 /DNA_ORIENTATION=-